MAEPEPQFGDIYKGTPEGLEQVLFDLRNTVYTDPLRRPSYAPREQAVQTPIAYNPFYGIPKKTANWDGDLLDAAALVNDFSSRLLNEWFGVGTIKFDTKEPIVTADDYFKDKSRTDYIRKQVGGEEVYNNWLEGRYNHIKDYNSLMNRFSYDLTKANANKALAEASGFERGASVFVTGILDPVAVASALVPFGAPARVASVAGNVARVAAGSFIGSAVYETGRNLTNEVYNIQDFDANDTISNLVMGTVAGTVIGTGFNYKSIARASRLNRLATSGVVFDAMGRPTSSIGGFGLIRQLQSYEEGSTVANVAKTIRDLGLDNEELGRILKLRSDMREQASRILDTKIQNGEIEVRPMSPDESVESYNRTVREPLLRQEIATMLEQNASAKKTQTSRVKITYDVENNRIISEEFTIPTQTDEQPVLLSRTVFHSLDEISNLPDMVDADNLFIRLRDEIGLSVAQKEEQAAARVGTKPNYSKATKEELTRLYPNPKDVFFAVETRILDDFTNQLELQPPKIRKIKPITLDEITNTIKNPKRITSKKTTVIEGENVPDSGADSMGIVQDTITKTIVSLAQRPSINPITVIGRFITEFWDNVGQSIGLLDKGKLRTLTRAIRSEEFGRIEPEELLQIIKREKLDSIKNRAFAWRTGGAVAGAVLGYYGLSTTGISKYAKKKWDALVGNETAPEILDLTTKYMTQEEKQSFESMANLAYNDTNTFNNLLFAASLIEQTKSDFAYSRELEAIRKARLLMDDSRANDFTSLNLRLNSIINKELKNTEHKKETQALRNVLYEMGMGDAFEESVDQLVDVSIEMEPHLTDFIDKLPNNLQEQTIVAIQDSMNNKIRKTIGSYDRQVNAFFAEVVARMGNDGNEFLYASTRIRKSLGMIENGLLNGIDNNGEAYSANTIIQALGAGMIAKLQNSNATGDDIRQILIEQADLTDIEEYLMTIGINLVKGTQ